MTEPDTLPPDMHPTVALLPWYLNGTLSVEERTDVSAHLQECPACRTEMEELVRMNEQIKRAVRTGPLPSAGLAQTVLSRVRQEARLREEHRLGSRATAQPNGFIAGIDQWLRSLLVPQWVPTLVAAFLVAQLGLLTWSLTEPSAPGVGSSGAITSRGLESPTARLKIEFQPAATMQDMQALLKTMHGRVIDGPTADGAYIIEIPASDPAAVERHATTLRNRREVIRHLEVLTP
jgi:anti-sigma factor RsiW